MAQSVFVPSPLPSAMAAGPGRTWADVVVTTATRPKPTTPMARSLLANLPAEPTQHDATLPPEFDTKIADAEIRTRVLRRLPHGTSAHDIFRAIIMSQMNTTVIADDNPAYTQVVQIQRDANDVRRWTVTFASKEAKAKYASREWVINKTKIPPTTTDFQGYIPITPYYLGESDFRSILGQYGEVKTLEFQTLRKPNGQRTKIRTSGLSFSLVLAPGRKVPDAVDVRGQPIWIIDKNSPKNCSTCGKSGHLRQNCYTGFEARLDAAQKKLENQTKGTPLEAVITELHGASHSDGCGVIVANRDDILRKVKKQERRRRKDEEYEQAGAPPRVQSPPSSSEDEMDDEERAGCYISEDEDHTVESPLEDSQPDSLQRYIATKNDIAEEVRNCLIDLHFPGRKWESLTHNEKKPYIKYCNTAFTLRLDQEYPDKEERLGLEKMEREYEERRNGKKKKKKP